MDTAVGLVQAYLRVNGYFTVAEYPVLDATGPGGPRTITDLDILAVRLHRAPGASGTVDAPLDPALGAGGGADMIGNAEALVDSGTALIGRIGAGRMKSCR